MTTTEEAEQGEYERIVEIQTAKLREEFKKIDKDGNSKIDEQELMSFLESKGKTIDKESFLRLIRTLDIDSDGYLTIDEFISSYIRIMGELKITITQNEQKIKEIEKEQIENEAKLEEHKNEKYNSEGLSLDSHINVHLDLVEINDSRLSSFDNIEAIISKGDFSKKFSSNQQEGNNFFFNKELKIPVSSRDEILKVEIMNRGKEIGKNEIPLSTINSQTEYDLDLILTNEMNDSENLLTIKIKITFIWNLYEKYKGEYDVNLKKLEKYKNVVSKSIKIRDSLDKPFNILSFVEQENQKNDFFLSNKRKTSPQEYAFADNIEVNIKNSLKLNNIKWGWLIKTLCYLLIILSFFNLFKRADFINILLPVYMLAILSTSIQSKQLSNLNLFFFACIFSLGTDFLWLFFRSSFNKADGGIEDGIRGFVYFISFISFGIKILLIFSIWISKLKLERGNREGLEDL